MDYYKTWCTSWEGDESQSFRYIYIFFFFKGESKCSDNLDANVSIDTKQSRCVFFWFPIYKVGKFSIKMKSSPPSWLAMTSHHEGERIIFEFLQICQLNASLLDEVIQTEVVSCYTNGRKIRGLPEIGRGLFKTPECRSGRQNSRFCARNVLQSTAMKQQGCLDLVVDNHKI